MFKNKSFDTQIKSLKNQQNVLINMSLLISLDFIVIHENAIANHLI